jgi:hypothetical protein
MIFYPYSLPCVSRAEGFSASISAGLVRTPFESGNARQRRTHQVLPHQLSLSWDVSQAQLAAWLTWTNRHAWTDWVLINIPGLHASQAGVNTLATPVRFASDLSTELLAGRGLWYWRIRVTAEYLPTPADLDVPDTITTLIVAGTPAHPALDWIVAGVPSAPSPWPPVDLALALGAPPAAVH